MPYTTLACGRKCTDANVAEGLGGPWICPSESCDTVAQEVTAEKLNIVEHELHCKSNPYALY